jgi:hypothetical protein
MSGQKSWSQLTDPEKIEALHHDLENLIRLHNNVAAQANRIEATLTEVAKTVETTEKRLDKAQIPPA